MTTPKKTLTARQQIALDVARLLAKWERQAKRLEAEDKYSTEAADYRRAINELR